MFCKNYQCSHNVTIDASKWPDGMRLSDLEPALKVHGGVLANPPGAAPATLWGPWEAWSAGAAYWPVRRMRASSLKKQCNCCNNDGAKPQYHDAGAKKVSAMACPHLRNGSSVGSDLSP